MPLTPELQRLAADLDAQFAAEDREIIRQAKQDAADEATSAFR